MVDDIVEFIRVEFAEAVEHEVPLGGQAGEHAFVLIFLVNLVGEFFEGIDIVRFFFRDGADEVVVDVFFPFGILLLVGFLFLCLDVGLFVV